jgi:hypothetical protein
LSSLVNKLHRHTNANRQLALDSLSAKLGVCTSLIVTRARLVLLNDYEPSMGKCTFDELKDKLKIEIQRSLDMHIQAHNQAIKLDNGHVDNCRVHIVCIFVVLFSLENGNRKYATIRRKRKIVDQEKTFVSSKMSSKSYVHRI